MTAENDELVINAFIAMLQKLTPELYAIRSLNDKLVKDVGFGEIHITEFVQDGKVVRVQAIKTIASEKVLE